MRTTRATILSSTMPHLSPSPRCLHPRRAQVQPCRSSPPPQGLSHPSALPFPSLLPFGRSHTFSSPKRLFPAGTVELPKALALPLAPPAARGATLPPQSCNYCTPISKTSPQVLPAQFQPQISQSPPWPQDTPTPPLTSSPWPLGAPRLGTGSGERDLLSTRCLSTGGEWISAR